MTGTLTYLAASRVTRPIGVASQERGMQNITISFADSDTRRLDRIRCAEGVQHGEARHQGERRLMLAVLESAVRDFQAYATASTRRGRRLFAEVYAWFGSVATDHPFDFERICQALGFDPSFIRQGVRRSWGVRRQEWQPSAAVAHLPIVRTTAGRVGDARALMT